MNKWTVTKDRVRPRWIANRAWHTATFPTWEVAYRYAYLHAVASRHEVP